MVEAPLASQPTITPNRIQYLSRLIRNRRPSPSPRGRSSERNYALDARTLTPHFPGIGRYVANLTAAIIPQLASGERMTILFDSRYPLALPVSPEVRMIAVDASPLSLRQQWILPSVIRRSDCTLYHSTYSLMPYRPGVPVVLTAYDLIPLLFPTLSTWRARVLFRHAMRKALRSAHSVIAISHCTRNDLARIFPFASDRITVIPPAVAESFSPPAEPAARRIREKYALPDEFLLYLGTNRPHKNTGRLLEAWRRTRASRVALAMAGCAGEPEPDRNISWLGQIPDDDLPALLGAATAFVFPSLYEGFGLPVLEAMACGTPVICSSTPALQETAGDAALYFDAADTDSIQIALERILEDNALRLHLKDAGLARAQAFSWSRAAAETLNVYRSVSR